MNRKTITTTVVSLAKAFCLAGLLSVPAYSSASTVSFEKVNGMYILKAEDSTVKQVFDYLTRDALRLFHLSSSLFRRISSDGYLTVLNGIFQIG